MSVLALWWAIGCASLLAPAPSGNVPNPLDIGSDAVRRWVVREGETYRAVNPAQEWVTRFDGRGFSTRPKTGDWTWGLELESYGFPDAETAARRPAGTSADGPRVDYEWDGRLVEWFINDARGLEHGFTLRERPAGGHGLLTFRLAVRGGLRAETGERGRDVRFVNDAGVVRVHYTGLTVFDADEGRLPARFDAIGDRLVLSIDDRNARYPLTIDPVAEQAYVKASNTGSGDTFGAAIALSDDTLVVGAPGEDSAATGVNGNGSNNSAHDAGAVYVFAWNGTTWAQQAYLKPSHSDPTDLFGTSVTLSGDTLAVGAPGEGSAATGVNGNASSNGASGSGAVYVFVRNGATWTQQAYLKASNTGGGDAFGHSVSLDGDTLVVGAAAEDSAASGVNGNPNNDSAEDSGAVYVFARNGTMWTQQAYLKASNADAGDYFGVAVSLSGETAVVGAVAEDSTATGVNGNENNESAENSGAAYVFVRNGTTWSQQSYLKASNTGPSDHFGASVSIASHTILVGAPFEDSSAVGVNGDQENNSANGAGAAYVFTWNGSKWNQQAYLKESNTDAGDAFGTSVSVQGDTAVVGAPFEDGGSTGIDGPENDNGAYAAGAAYVFSRAGTTWSQRAYVKGSNTGAGDRFGDEVCAWHGRAVVGATNEAGGTSGVNGDGSDDSKLGAGAAYVYDLGEWWADLGFGLSGTNGIPLLAGSGTLAPGTSGALTLASAAPNATVLLLVSTTANPTPGFGGTVVPIPPIGALLLFTGASGSLVLSWGAWPTGVPYGTRIYFQCAIDDPGATAGVSLSNALESVSS